MTEATNDLILFKRILKELTVSIGGPIPRHSDSKSAIKWATGNKHTENVLHMLTYLATILGT
jgi:hypothetical protein